MSDFPFGLREDPFAAGHERRFLHHSPERDEILSTLTHGLKSGEAFVLLTGEAGTGKSSIIHEAFGNRKFRGSVAILTNPYLTRNELLEEICIRFGLSLPEAPSKPQLMAMLERHLIAIRGQAQGQPGVLVIDEAHLLDIDLLEELRLLVNLQAKGRKLLQVVLVGLPLLEETLALPRLESLRQRIALRCRLEPFDEEETRGYMLHRLEVAGANPKCMTEEASREIHHAARGVAREINTLASDALGQASAAEADVIKPEHVSAAVAERRSRAVMSGTYTLRSSDPPMAARTVKAAESAAESTAPPPVRQSEPARQPAPEEAKAEPAEPAEAASPAKAAEEAPSRPEPAEPKTRPAASGKPGAQKGAKAAREQSGKQAQRAEGRREKKPSEELAERTASDPEVQDWVARFKSGGPIQIGSRSGAAMRPLSEFEESLSEAELESKFTAPEAEAGPRLPAAKKQKSGMVTKPRSGRRRRGWNDPSRLSIAAGLVLFGTVAMILITRSRQAAGPSEPPARTTALTRVEPETEKTIEAGEKSEKKRSSSTHSTPSRSSHDTERERLRTSTPTRPKPNEPARTSAPVFAPTPSVVSDSADPARRYSLEVATYINESRAREEMDRLSVLTALPTRLRAATDFNGTTYRILVGRFDQRAQAERAAEDLVGRGILNEARITTVPTAPPR